MKFPGHESARLEFKESVPKKEQIINTVIAFCNMHGGKLVLGVADDGTILGIPEKEAYKLLEWLNESIYKACVPPILPQIYQQHIDGKYLVVVDVSSGMQKPYYRKSQGLENGTYIRLGSSTVKADADLIEDLKLQSRGQSYDQTPIYHATVNDLNNKKIASFFDQRRNGLKVSVNNKMLKSYEIIVEQHSKDYPTVCGMLLFGNDVQQYLTEGYILCSHFSGIKGREAIASQVCKGTLVEQFDAAYDFVAGRLPKSYVIKDKRRIEKMEIPTIALREVIMNALLHRNYNLKAPIKIAIYGDRIEVFSPGVFPGAMDIDQLESGITYTRNVAIAKILWESGYIEKMGSGLITLFASYKEAGLLRPEIIEGINFIKYILPRVSRSEVKENDASRVLALFKQFDEVSRGDVVKLLNIPKTTAGRLLGSMVDAGEINRIGKGKNTRYCKS